jgi:hypothetical protein
LVAKVACARAEWLVSGLGLDAGRRGWREAAFVVDPELVVEHYMFSWRKRGVWVEEHVH